MIDVLYDDNDVVVCLKPVGVVSEAGGLPDMLEEQFNCKIYTVHRLDKSVGGVMVYAKNQPAAAQLSRQFSDRTADKKYLCVVKGQPDIDFARLDDLLYKDTRTNKTYVVNRERKGVKKASLEYKLIDSAVSDVGTLSLLSVHLLTGRSHQIRVQFASRHLPLLGDFRYGGKEKGLDVSLWSCSLSFAHPRTQNKLSYSCNPPSVYPWSLFDLTDV